MAKHLIRFLFGLIPVGVLIGLGLLFLYSEWYMLVAALIALVYPVGWLFGKVTFPKE